MATFLLVVRFLVRVPSGRGALGALLCGLTLLTAACGSGSRAIDYEANPPPPPVPPPALTSIDVGPPNPSIALGLTYQFRATGIYADGSKGDISSMVTWSSSAPAVALLSRAGIATSVVPGQTTITAALGSLSGSTTLTITAAALASVEVTSTALTMASGTRQQFDATAIYTDNSKQDVTNSVTWTSGSPAVATISNSAGTIGLATAVAPGTSAITAALGAVTSAPVSLTVTAAALVSIGITPPNPTLVKGTSQQLTATGIYADGSRQDLTAQVVWSSSAAAVASFSTAANTHGLAIAAGVGPAILTAASGTVTATTSLTVTAATLASISVTSTSSTIPKGTTQQFAATALYTDLSRHDVTALVVWSSSAPGVATISNAAGYDGLARGVGTGPTTITATLNGVSGSMPLTVTAATLLSIGITPPKSKIANGTSQPFLATGLYSDNTTRDLTATATWASSTPTVATINNAAGSNGIATGASAGTTTITAMSAGITSAPATLAVTAATLVSIAVTPTSASIANQTSQQFTAIGTFSDGTRQTLTSMATWASSASAVATISNAAGSSGIATGASAGTTTITAAFAGITSATVTLTVTGATLVSLAVTPANDSIANGTSLQFVATGTFSDATTQMLTSVATWASGTPTVASISNTTGYFGNATALSPGSTLVSASVGGVASPPVPLTVTAATLVSIAITPANPRIFDGSTEQLTATGTYSDGSTQIITNAVTWAPMTSTIAPVSNAAGSQGLATALTVGTESVTATDPLTGIASAATTLTVTSAEYAYAANFGDGTVSQYTVGNDGSLTPMAAPFVAAGSEPFSIAIATDAAGHGRYAYVANYGIEQPGLASVSEYAIGADGSLSNIGTATTGTGPNGITVFGGYAYTANYHDNNVSQFAIGADGTLSPLSTPTVAAGTGASMITITAARHAYVANFVANSVSEYSVGTDGTLTALVSNPTVAAGAGANYIVVDPSGSYAYVANYSGNSISEYTIAGDGSLHLFATLPGVPNPRFMSIDPAGPYVYVANGTAATVSQFTIGPNGSLTYQSAWPTDTTANSVIVDATGRFVYAANRGPTGNAGHTVSQFSIGAGGSLSPLTPSAPAGSAPAAIVTTTAY